MSQTKKKKMPTNKSELIIYILKRLGFALLTVWAVITITFIIMKAIPGNPFADEKIQPAALENLMRYYKLDRPLWEQYLSYLKSAVTFDFGPSLVSSTLSPNYYISSGLPISMELGLRALVLSLFAGIILGSVAAIYHNRIPDYLASIAALIGVSVPTFIMARILVIIFSANLGWLPSSGWDSQISTILPTITLAALPTATFTRLMRSSMLDVLSQDYIKTAKAKGLSGLAVIMKHALKNALLPIVSSLSTVVTNLLTGSFVIEKIFRIPGMGDALVKSVGNRDYPVIMAATVVYSLILIVITLIVDLIYPLIDPRIKLTGGAKVAAVEE